MHLTSSCRFYFSTLSVLMQFALISPGSAHEGTGRTGFKDPGGVEVEAEFYAGERGYLHGGLGMIMPLNDRQEVGLVGHFVREDSKGDIFPSLGAEFVQELDHDYALEGFTFGYLPVDDQNAWALCLRGSRVFELREDVEVTPFFGPSFAQVQALDEVTDDAVDISHFMLVGGAGLVAGPWDVTVFGTYSFFSRDPVGLETHVDLEEMTHFAAYENNDGFARNTLGTEVSYEILDWLSLTGRYVWIEYEDATRHAVSVAPQVEITPELSVSAGVQWLCGDGEDNTLFMTGVAYAF